MLVRVKKMDNAKTTIGRILAFVYARQCKFLAVRQELSRSEPDWEMVASSYSELVRLSARITLKIAGLVDEEKCLKRPFIFQDIQYEDPKLHMYGEMRKLRQKILARCPEIEGLEILYLESGEIGCAEQHPLY